MSMVIVDVFFTFCSNADTTQRERILDINDKIYDIKKVGNVISFLSLCVFNF